MGRKPRWWCRPPRTCRRRWPKSRSRPNWATAVPRRVSVSTCCRRRPRRLTPGVGSSWRGATSRASEEFSAVIKLDPGHAWAYCFRAITTHLTGRPRDALADYTEAIGSSRTSTLPTGPGAGFATRWGTSPCAGRLRRSDPAQALQRDHPRSPRPALRRPGPVRPCPGRLQRGDPARTPNKAEAYYRRGQTRDYSGGQCRARSWTSPRRSSSTRPMPGPIAIGAMPSRGWATGHSANADRAMVDRLARRPARTVKFRAALRPPAPPSTKAESDGPGVTAPSGPDLRQPSIRQRPGPPPGNERAGLAEDVAPWRMRGLAADAG